MTTIDTALLMGSAAYRELYQKYLGTLNVLGDAAAHIQQENDCRESLDACMEDAQRFLAPRVRIYQTLNRWDLEPK